MPKLLVPPSVPRSVMVYCTRRLVKLASWSPRSLSKLQEAGEKVWEGCDAETA
jgi:hypothetical protein